MKRRLILCALTLSVLLVGVGSAHAQVVCPATTDVEWQALLVSSPQQATFIRTIQDFYDYKARARFAGHPLNGLTAQQLADFAASVWIKDGGVVTMNVGILKDNLSSANYANVLAAFGISVSLAKDYVDYRCESPHNCLILKNWICMSGC